MTPGWSSGGKRLAGKLHEPFDRADGGRVATPNHLRLYTEEAFEQWWPQGTGGEGGGKEAGQGERDPAYQGPDTAPGFPCHGCLTTYGRPLWVPARHHPRQEPGAVVPHAGIWAGCVG
jgi:hypothetical protein